MMAYFYNPEVKGYRLTETVYIFWSCPIFKRVGLSNSDRAASHGQYQVSAAERGGHAVCMSSVVRKQLFFYLGSNYKLLTLY